MCVQYDDNTTQQQQKFQIEMEDIRVVMQQQEKAHLQQHQKQKEQVNIYVSVYVCHIVCKRC